MKPPASLRSASVDLVVRRRIESTPERLFEAWTTPDQLILWWGPRGVTCSHAEIDLRVGGRYRIANEFPDGNVIWIFGEFEIVAPPTRLVYTWAIEGVAGSSERVTVRFVRRGKNSTEVVVVHRQIRDHAARDAHEHGWTGCLEHLERYVSNGVDSIRA